MRSAQASKDVIVIMRLHSALVYVPAHPDTAAGQKLQATSCRPPHGQRAQPLCTQPLGVGLIECWVLWLGTHVLLAGHRSWVADVAEGVLPVLVLGWPMPVLGFVMSHQLCLQSWGCTERSAQKGLHCNCSWLENALA